MPQHDRPGNPFTDEDAPGNPFVPEDGGAAGAFATSAGREFINNLLGIPRAIGQAPSMIAAGVRGAGAVVTGGEFDFQRRFEETAEDRGVLADIFHKIPAPKIEEIGAGVRSIPGLFGKQPIGERVQ